MATLDLTLLKDNIELVIFDLDQTLIEWHFGEPHLFPDVVKILNSLYASKFKMAVATYNSWAEHYLKKMGLDHYFDMIGIDIVNTFDRLDYKKDLLSKILEQLNVPPNKALFFDDQMKNIRTGCELGIHSIYVNMNGLTEKIFLEAFDAITISDSQ